MLAELAAALLVVMATPGILRCRAQAPVTQPEQVVDQVWQTVDQKFIDPNFNHHDWRRIHHELQTRRYTSWTQAYAAIRSMLQLLGEPQTRLLDPAEFAGLAQEFTGEVGGIGLVDIWSAVNHTTGGLDILHLVAGSPACKSGLRSQDRIEAVDGNPTRNLSADEVLMHTRGPVGTPVRLKMLRGNQHFEIGVVPEALTSHTVHALVIGDHDKPMGYIALAQFGQKSAQEMRDAIAGLQAKNAQGFVLDLRNNPGGFVPASRDIAGYFLGKGKLVYYSFDQRGTRTAWRTATSLMTDKPLVVIVNRATASAAEMLAGALTDNERAKLVGTTTFGQGMIHEVRPLPDGSGLVIAVGRFETPAGRVVEHEGITPDDDVKSDERESCKNWPPIDRQYEEAIKILQQSIAGFPNPVRPANSGQPEMMITRPT
ncbi:MAG TPA: S41 family peptidase [Terriglobia bacterium]|nr:S41 family peptidase [Terriglobia bacterium]